MSPLLSRRLALLGERANLPLPYALTLAIFAGFTELLPVIGVFFAAVPAVLLSIGGAGDAVGLVALDDDARLTGMVGDYLRSAGFEIEVAPTLAAGRELRIFVKPEEINDLAALELPSGVGTRPFAGDEGLVRQRALVGDKVALLTDGRFSGATRGLCIGYAGPEAADKGPIAALRDGDIIVIDVENRCLNVELNAEQLKERLAAWIPPAPRYTDGVLAKFARLVTDARHVTYARHVTNYDSVSKNNPRKASRRYSPCSL